jgi:hypothetical protein
LFILLEFYMANFTGRLMRDYVPYLELEVGTEVVSESIMAGSWIRPRGLAVEAGHMSTFFEFALPMAYIHVRHWRGWLQILFYGVSISSFIMLTSAAGIFALLIAFLVVLTLSNVVTTRAKWKIALVICVLFGAAFTSEDVREYSWRLVFSKVAGYVGLEPRVAASSAEERSLRALSALSIVEEKPFGVGWGTAASLSLEGGGTSNLPFGFVSFYAEAVVAGGWLGLTCWLIYIGRIMMLAWRRQDTPMMCAWMAAISTSIHYITISNFWFPVFWLSYAMVTYLHEHPREDRAPTEGRMPFFLRKNAVTTAHVPQPIL